MSYSKPGRREGIVKDNKLSGRATKDPFTHLPGGREEFDSGEEPSAFGGNPSRVLLPYP